MTLPTRGRAMFSRLIAKEEFKEREEILLYGFSQYESPQANTWTKLTYDEESHLFIGERESSQK